MNNTSKNNLKFEDVYNDTYGMVLNWTKRSIKDESIAEEITSDTFMKVNEHLHNYSEKQSALTTWVITIANNKIIDHLRKIKNKQRTTSLSENVDESGKETIQLHSNTLTPDQIIENKRIKSVINTAINELPEQYKDIAEMYFLTQYTYNEICEYLDLPIGTVKGNISRIRKKLQVKLNENHITAASC